MTTTPPWTMASVPPDLWQQVRNAPFRFLGLDYDGTLAPFAIDPMHARPLSGIADLLWDLAASSQTEVAIITGRPAHEVPPRRLPADAAFLAGVPAAAPDVPRHRSAVGKMSPEPRRYSVSA